MTTIGSALASASRQLADVGIDSADTDAELLLAHALREARGSVAAGALTGRILDAEALQNFGALVSRRARREPLQHITGRAPFRHLHLQVGPGVFVPRPETELLAQIAIDHLRSVPETAPIAVDLGAGSGAIGLAIATEVPNAVVRAVERSTDALAWTIRNADEIRADNYRAELADLADALADLDGTVTVIASNPPYVPADAVPRDPEVRMYDPPQALYGGDDGLDVVRQVSRTGMRLGRSGALVAIEHGEWQGSAIRALLTDDGWRAPATHQDLTVRDRVTTAIRP